MLLAESCCRLEAGGPAPIAAWVSSSDHTAPDCALMRGLACGGAAAIGTATFAGADCAAPFDFGAAAGGGGGDVGAAAFGAGAAGSSPAPSTSNTAIGPP